MSDEIFPRTEICRDAKYQSMQVSSDWRMLPVAQLPFSMWDAAPQTLQTASNAQAYTTIEQFTALPWVLPPIFPEDVKLPPPSDLPGTSQMLEALVESLNISSQECRQGHGKDPISDHYITFSGRKFDVDAMTFEFHEEKMEFENYDLIINLPGQESILTTESWAFFIDRLSLVPDDFGIENHSDPDFEFIEDKLEFEEDDLAMSFPGQESILTNENFEFLCSKLEESLLTELKLQQNADTNGTISTPASTSSYNAGTCHETAIENGQQETPAEAKSPKAPDSPLPVLIVPRNEENNIQSSRSEYSSASRPLSTDVKDQDNAMKSGVKKRKNIFAGVICAKIIKSFVSKFMIV